MNGILDNKGLLQKEMNITEKELSISLDYAEDAKSKPIDYLKLPPEIQAELDDFAAALFDPEGGKIFVTGNAMAGKTFLIEQLFFNRSRYLQYANLGKVEFIRVTNDHVSLVERFMARNFTSFIELISNMTNLSLSQMVFVTESLEAAVGLSNLGCKVIYEISIATMVQLHKHEVTGAVKQWSSWDTVDANLIYLKPTSLTNTLAENLLDRLNAHYPHIDLQKKHIQMFINTAVEKGDLKIPDELLQDSIAKDSLMVPPGIWARAISRLASNIALNSDLKNKNGKVILVRAMNKVYQEFEPLFMEFAENFYDESGDLPEGLEQAIQDALSQSMPGIRVVSLSSKPTEAPEEVLDAPTSYSDFSDLGQRLSKEVLGQEEAITSVVNALKIPAAGLNLDTKPLRSMLFLGPTGVGKTQMALTIAKELMDKPLSIKRFDMSEFGQEHESSKLLGSPPGYVGFETGGVLTEYVKKRPQSIIILDEIEKAHPKIWTSFLQILDAGRMTDNKGETVDFTKTIIIMTSNIGAGELARPNLGFAALSEDELFEKRKNDAKLIVTKAVEGIFQPEMVNRIDDQIIFNSLPKAIIRDVVAKELKAITDRIKVRGYTLIEPNDDILDRLAELSDTSKYGAREVQRVVSRTISTLLADKVLTTAEKKNLTLNLNENKDIIVISD